MQDLPIKGRTLLDIQEAEVVVIPIADLLLQPRLDLILVQVVLLGVQVELLTVLHQERQVHLQEHLRVAIIAVAQEQVVQDQVAVQEVAEVLLQGDLGNIKKYSKPRFNVFLTQDGVFYELLVQ
jgi:hypothetical protein